MVADKTKRNYLSKENFPEWKSAFTISVNQASAPSQQARVFYESMTGKSSAELQNDAPVRSRLDKYEL